MSTPMKHADADPNCVDPVCKGKLDFLKSAFKEKMTMAPKSTSKETSNIDCPLDRDALGKSTWGLLHTMAAYYPDKPTLEEKRQVTSFMEALGRFYPCKYCAEDFRECLQNNPPSVESRKEFSIWMCEQHNEVNRKVGKKEFNCTLTALDRRWKTGDASCWKQEDDEEKASESLGQS